ncbi:MAG: class I SAM-dependent methyltransferase [Bradymonadaceae bacterium]
MSKEFWDEQFGKDEYRYGVEPNAFLAERAVDVLEPGARVVCFGEGEGRNAVWLARQGFKVTAVEQSSAGIAKMHALAKHHGVEVEAVQCTIEAFEPPQDGFDGVVLIYIHAPPEARRAIHAKGRESLKDGGVILLEGFTPEQRLLGRESGGPPAIEMLFTEAILREDFGELNIEYLETLEVELSEGAGHEGTANVIRMIARPRSRALSD